MIIKRINNDIDHYFKNKKNKFYFFLFLSAISAFLELLSLYSIIFIIYSLAGSVGLNLTLDIFYILRSFDEIFLLKCAIIFLILKNIIFLLFISLLSNFIGKSFTDYINNFIRNINSLNFMDALNLNQSKIIKMIPVQLEAVFSKYFFGLFVLLTDIISILLVFLFLSLVYPYEILTIMLPFLIFSYFIYTLIKKIIEIHSKNKNFLFENIIKNLRLNLISYDYIRLTKLRFLFENDIYESLSGIKDAVSKTYFFVNFTRYFYEIGAIILILLIFLINREDGVVKNLDLLVVLTSAFVRILPNLARLNSLLYSLSSVSSEVKEIQNQSNQIFTSASNFQQKTFLHFETNNKNIKKGKEFFLENLKFSYKKDQKIFDKFDLNFKRGNVYLIYAPSGSGKSTLGYILSGLIEPDTGKVSLILNSKESKKINYLPQHDFIINTTIMENITLSKTSSINKKIRESFDFANLNDFLSASNLNKVKINDFGNNLSGGQRRRISLARFHYNKSLINIVDEPTNSLDQENILKLIKNFKKFSKDCILIIFTHEKLLLKDKSFKNLTIKNNKIVQK
tara:strand:- start:5100 stop:6800 length:1701 start_codon:yes stop_codon:yes gene_type:complete